MARRPHQKNTATLSGQGVGKGDATSSGLACQAEVRGPEPARRLAGQTRPSAFPLRDGRIGAGEVACLRLPVAGRRQTGATTHRQVNDRLRRELSRAVRKTTRGAGPPPGRWSGRGALGARRSGGGEAQVLEASSRAQPSGSA